MSGLRLSLGRDQLLEADPAALPSILGVCRLLAIPVHWDETAGTLYIATPIPNEEAIPPMPARVPEDDMPVLVLGPETIIARRQEPLDRSPAPPKREREPKPHRKPAAAAKAPAPAEEPVAPAEPAPATPEVSLSGPISHSTTLHMFQWSRLNPRALRKAPPTAAYIHAFRRDVNLIQSAKNHPR